MSSKEELYKVLVESVPYGTLFFAYGVCVDANKIALELLDCRLEQLVGTLFDNITGEETTALINLKLQLKKAVNDGTKEVLWQCPLGDNNNSSRDIRINIVYVTEDGKELVVMLNQSDEVMTELSAQQVPPQQIVLKQKLDEQNTPSQQQRKKNSINSNDDRKYITDKHSPYSKSIQSEAYTDYLAESVPSFTERPCAELPLPNSTSISSEAVALMNSLTKVRSVEHSRAQDIGSLRSDSVPAGEFDRPSVTGIKFYDNKSHAFDIGHGSRDVDTVDLGMVRAGLPTENSQKVDHSERLYQSELSEKEALREAVLLSKVSVLDAQRQLQSELKDFRSFVDPLPRSSLTNILTPEDEGAPSDAASSVLSDLAKDVDRIKPWDKASRDYYFDDLTNLPNRQMLSQTIGIFLEESCNQQICGAVLVFDLDDFKDINDSWGASIGDQVIKKIGRAVTSLVTGENLLARIRGDEFALFIPELSNSISQAAWDAQAVAEKIGEIVAIPIFQNGHEITLTASIGISLVTDSSVTAEHILQYADTAMYEAKRKGRNSIAFFDPCISEKAQRQIEMNTRLRKAMDNQEFALYVQPQICVKSGAMLGGEVLLRWMSSEKITNMPSEFIPVLESSGLIIDVGRWVIRTACEYIRSFLDQNIWQDHMSLSVNISPRQFRDPQLLEIVQHSMKSYNIDPKYLNFEVTENLVIEDVDEAILKMEAIKSLGAMFSIDDFGIGYSSMIYLKRLPFDQLKIDREFIRNIHRDPESRGVVEAIMTVSKQYGLKVTAEGVENRETLAILKELGCHSYQGAHFSMPISCDHFSKLLAV